MVIFCYDIFSSKQENAMENLREIGSAFCRDFERITKLWKLRDSERLKILNLNSANRFNAYCSGTITVPLDIFRRIICVLEIHNALRTLFSGNNSAVNGWVHKPNKYRVFRGKPALALMLSGNLKDIRCVRDYLMNELQSSFY